MFGGRKTQATSAVEAPPPPAAPAARAKSAAKPAVPQKTSSRRAAASSEEDEDEEEDDDDESDVPDYELHDTDSEEERPEEEETPRPHRLAPLDNERANHPPQQEGERSHVSACRAWTWTTTSEDLREVFQQVGTVVNATSVCHEDSGRSKGWGTVLFETAEQAAAAIAGFNGVELVGRAMVIKIDRFQ